MHNLLDENQESWDDEVLNDILNERDMGLVRQIPVTKQRKDIWFWLFDDKGVFTVRSCYRKLRGELDYSDGAFGGNYGT